MTCQICLESFEQDKLYKVGCKSSVEHLICYECEGKWRSIPGCTQTCPTCRQPEVERTLDSIQRELNRVHTITIHDREVPRFSRCFMCVLLFFPIFFFGAFAALVDDNIRGE